MKHITIFLFCNFTNIIMQSPGPIYTWHLFPKLDAKLVGLLSSLSPSDWEKQTIAPLWTVKDIAAHLLDTNLRAVSMLRDGYQGESPGVIHGYQDLVAYLNRLNADWVNAMKRISPKVLIELLAITGPPYANYLKSLDPFEKAKFSVAWAGEEESFNWFHIAREYTEKWHHQQQIRLVVGQEEALYSPELYHPHLETSMRALPYHYRNIKGIKEELIQFSISGEGGGDWFLYYNGERWIQVVDATLNPICKVEIPGHIAWKLFTNASINFDKDILITGKQELGNKLLEMKAVMM